MKLDIMVILFSGLALMLISIVSIKQSADIEELKQNIKRSVDDDSTRVKRYEIRDERCD